MAAAEKILDSHFNKEDIIHGPYFMSENTIDVVEGKKILSEQVSSFNLKTTEKALKDIIDKGNLLHSIIGFPVFFDFCSDKKSEATLVSVIKKAFAFIKDPENTKKNKILAKDVFELFSTLVSYSPDFTSAKFLAGNITECKDFLNATSSRPLSSAIMLSGLSTLAYHNDKYKQDCVKIISDFFVGQLTTLVNLCKQSKNTEVLSKLSFKELQEYLVKSVNEKTLPIEEMKIVEKICALKQSIGETFYYLCIINAADFSSILGEETFSKKILQLLFKQLKTKENIFSTALLNRYANDEIKAIVKSVSGVSDEEISKSFVDFSESMEKEQDINSYILSDKFCVGKTNNIETSLSNLRKVSRKLHDIALQKSISITICPLSFPAIFQVIKKSIETSCNIKIDMNHIKTFQEKAESEPENEVLTKIKNLNGTQLVSVAKRSHRTQMLLKCIEAKLMPEEIKQEMQKHNFFLSVQGIEKEVKFLNS